MVEELLVQLPCHRQTIVALVLDDGVAGFIAHDTIYRAGVESKLAQGICASLNFGSPVDCGGSGGAWARCHLDTSVADRSRAII